MAWRAALGAQLLLGQLSLIPLRLPGAGAQVTTLSFQLWQPQDKVSVTVGEMLTLTCTTSSDRPAGPVKWLKGWGSENQTIYGQTGSFARVTRGENTSNTDFSIHIRDVQPEDAGTYYCVKFQKLFPDGEELLQRGKGTEVSVHEATPVPTMVAIAVVLCFLLLGLFVACCMYRRKHRGEAQSPARPAAMGGFSPIPLQCCARTPGTPSSEVLDAESSHLANQQNSKEDNYIHYADLQPLPSARRHVRSPDAAGSEYASVRVAAK
ncbi:PREDICTED: signal-regulatory protein beta-1 isoform 3-like [Calidris pugnax]|uniref:signal-regulatory protein beta-1 isoform 3-like n=1 Tax=Calidris pugnax TaxID=198806 RepID=UPI00071D30BD|nr:PREDICTED: signal-regulatory protein beta-1 isoform 3-like [Calidris pugnax]